MLVWLLIGMSAVAEASAQPAPTAREQAVAIDRVEIPPADTLRVERIGPPLAAPWSIAFLPGGDMLVTEKHGGIRRIAPDGRASAPLPGGPVNVLQRSDSGLLDVVLDPDFGRNGHVYVAFVEGNEQANRTAIWKARLEGERLTGGRVIFRVNESKAGPGHPGGRMIFLPDHTLLLTVGDGFSLRDKAQDPASHLGKVLRLTRDGAAAPGNPFVGRAGHAPEVWTMGHRNIQGLARDPATGTIWAHEHGPRGGDEINALVAGGNYGWPTVSFGIDYDGTVITERTQAPGMTGPRFVWSPSIAPSGLVVYSGTRFPQFQGRLLLGALASRMVAQVRINPKNGLLAEEARLLTGLKARIRDARESPDGHIYLLTDESPGHLLRIVPPGS
jgi:aldose sugar dehydrogenase